MTKTLKMWYYLPGQSKLFSKAKSFETNKGEEWERAVNIAHENGYKIVKIEIVKADTCSNGLQSCNVCDTMRTKKWRAKQ